VPNAECRMPSSSPSLSPSHGGMQLQRTSGGVCLSGVCRPSLRAEIACCNSARIPAPSKRLRLPPPIWNPMSDVRRLRMTMAMAISVGVTPVPNAPCCNGYVNCIIGTLLYLLCLASPPTPDATGAVYPPHAVHKR
jgi:hypothetical protein